MHRDLSPANILIDLDTFHIVISDLGSAKRVQSGEVECIIIIIKKVKPILYRLKELSCSGTVIRSKGI